MPTKFKYMKTFILILIPVFLMAGCQNTAKNKAITLRQDQYFTEAQGREELEKLESMYTDKARWEQRKKKLRVAILTGMNLSPMPERTPLNAVINSKRIKDGYTVENVYFESFPGYYVCGNLYRPIDGKEKHPAVLCPHGHFEGDTLSVFGRFRPDMQNRCASLARMGAVVLSYNMFAYGENIKQLDPMAIIEKPSSANIWKHHDTPLALTVQTWNSIRALDFLQSLPDVNAEEIGVTGASGGGTQTFLLAAVDDRVSVSVPVVMVSCHFFGGCQCESGLPVHESASHFTNNAEIAAMVAPKPMLMISDGADWTKTEPTLEYPFIRRTYSFYDAEDQVESVHFPEGVHDYSFPKRIPVYKFLAKHMGLNLTAVTNADGQIDESRNDIEDPEVMLSFSTANPLPANALSGLEAIRKGLYSE